MTTTKTKKLPKLVKLPRVRKPDSAPVSADLMPTEADVEAIRNVHNAVQSSQAVDDREAAIDSIAARLRRGLGLKPQPVAAKSVDTALFTKTVVEGMLGPDASIIINAALAKDETLLPRMVAQYGDITQPVTHVRVICEVGRSMFGYEKVASFCKALLHEKMFRDYFVDHPEVAKALKDTTKVDIASDHKLGEELASKFLALKSDAMGFDPNTPILPLARNVHELQNGKDVVVKPDGSVTLDGVKFNWFANTAARLQNHDGVRWLMTEYGALLGSDFVQSLQAAGCDTADAAANCLAWPFAVAGEGLAKMSVVLQDKSGKAIRIVGRGILGLVLGATVLAKGTGWLIRQAKDWIVAIGRDAYNRLVNYATGVWEWLSTGFVNTLRYGGVPAALATAGFVVATTVAAVMCPAIGGAVAMTLGAPLLAGEVAGLGAGVGVIAAGAVTLGEAYSLARDPALVAG